MDAADLRQQLAAAQRDNVRYRRILEAIAVHVWVSDAQGRESTIIAGESGPVGVSVQVEQRLALVHPDDRPALLECMARAVANREPLDFVLRGLNDLGEWRKLRIQSRPILDSQGETTEWIGVSTDVSRQEEAEAELRKQHDGLKKSQDRLSIALIASEMGVWDCDLQSGDIQWSPEVSGILNVEQRISTLEQFTQLVHPDDVARMMELFTQSQSECATFRGEFRTRSGDGSVRWMGTVGKPYYDCHGQPIRMVGTIQDITERKQVDQWLHMQNFVLHQIATGRPLTEVLRAISSLVETGLAIRGRLSCLMLLDQSQRLRVTSASTVPDEFHKAIDGVAIGPNVGSCGTAAFRGETVIVEDIATDPLWTDYRDVALASNLRSCWSVPILGAPKPGHGGDRQEVLGVFAVYCHEPSRPTQHELRSMAQAVDLAAIAIERYRSEQSLRESETRFRELANAMPQLVWTADRFGKPTYANRRLLETLRCHGSDWLSAVHPDDREESLRRYSEAIYTGENYVVEHRLRMAVTGEYRWYLSRATASRDSEGQVVCWYGAATDIHDLKATEQALREERDRFSAIAAASPGAIFSFVLRPDGTCFVPYAAPTLTSLFGIDPDEIRNDASSILRLVHADDLQAIQESLRSSAHDMTSTSALVRVHHPQKGTIWVDCQASPRRFSDGTVHWHGVLTDVTVRKRMEDKLLQSQKMEAVGRLAGGIAHDFNNLLTVIIGACDLIDMQVVSRVEQAQHVEAIRLASHRAAGLTKQLLAFSRQQAATLQILNPNVVVQGAEPLLRRMIGNAIQLHCQLSSKVSHIQADPLQIEQILINLALNSRDAMASGGQITVATQNVERVRHGRYSDGNTTPEKFVDISITDTGSGIDPVVQKHIFEPFFTTKPVGKGTGLGLAVVHGIVSQSRGIVEVESEAGRGTTIHVLLPVTESTDSEPVVGRPLLRVSLGVETVLVVDDEAAICDIAVSTLRSLGYRVLAAHGPEQAMRQISNWHEDLHAIITDLVMPGCDGEQLVEFARKRFPHIKAIIMSGHDVLRTHRAHHEHPAHHFLAKPFAPSQLAEALRNTLD